MLADTGDGDGEMTIGANEEKCMDIPRQIGLQYHIFLVERSYRFRIARTPVLMGRFLRSDGRTREKAAFWGATDKKMRPGPGSGCCQN